METRAREIAKSINGLDGRQLEKKLVELGINKESGILVLFGASDDLLELRGIIEDEVSAYNGFDTDEIYEWEEQDSELANILREHNVKAIWCPNDELSWKITTNNHNIAFPFNIMDGDEIYCTGLVIDTKIETSEYNKNILKLEDEILELRDFYTKGSPKVSDEIYDELENRLKTISPNSEVLNKVGSQNKNYQNVKSVEHKTKMLSLDKVYTVEELKKWSKEEILLSLLKIDGASCSLVYENGDLILAKTRGDGKMGEDITDHVRFIDSIPKKIPNKVSVEIRGEIYCKKSSFKELSDDMERLGLDRPNSERNIVSGLIGRVNNIYLCKHLDFFAYSLLSDAPFENTNELEDLDDLSRYGFQTPRVFLHSRQADLDSVIKQINSEKAGYDFLIDGIVFVIFYKKEQKDRGYTSHHPKYKMAFKFKSEEKDTLIEDIKWQVSRNGILTPVAVVKTVELAGANVTNVTLHNYGIVRQFNLKAGDEIKITRSGEVIPKFIGVVNSVKGDHQKPSSCPCCGSEVYLDDIRLFCKNLSCGARVTETILNYIKVMNIEDIDEKRVEELLEKKIISNIESLYELSIEKLLTLDKVKEKSATKIYNNIQGSKNPKLAEFLVALGITSLGLSSAEKIINSGFHSLDSFLKLTLEDIIKIDGFAAVSASNILTSLEVKRETIENLLRLGVNPQDVSTINKSSNSKINGKNFVITGTLSRPRKEIEDLIKTNGASVVGSVSSKTNYLLTNDSDSGSSKAKKALELGVSIISEEEFYKMIKDV